MGTNEQKAISLYNDLTEEGEMPENMNFLESIRYKMDNGNKILGFLLGLQNSGTPFTVVKGFRLNEEDFSKFERCIINTENEIDIEDARKVAAGGMNIRCLGGNQYELSLN